MKIYSKNIENGYLNQEFGANGTRKNSKGIVDYSFHIAWENLPKDTVSLAIAFYDHDAVPVCGFTWIHWLAANIDPKLNELSENASIQLKDKMVQGKNSWSSGLLPKEMQSHETLFGGCAPPNGDHKYDVEVFALNKKLNLTNGFLYNELLHAMEGNILDKARINFIYKKIIE
ncbi:MAG: YbhB/YbcL family Raf kinase inhibitor-like protein [Metamycoplasmataceae bacterium]